MMNPVKNRELDMNSIHQAIDNTVDTKQEELPQARFNEMAQPVKHRKKKREATVRQSRSTEIKLQPFKTPVDELLAGKMPKLRSSSCIQRIKPESIHSNDSYETLLVRKMFGQFRESVKTEGDE